MVKSRTREELASGLVRIGEKEMTGEDEAEADAYFAPDFRFHGPHGGEWDYQGLKEYFASLRAAFADLAAEACGLSSPAVTTAPSPRSVGVKPPSPK
jgi:hypothetical protein